ALITALRATSCFAALLFRRRLLRLRLRLVVVGVERADYPRPAITTGHYPSFFGGKPRNSRQQGLHTIFPITSVSDRFLPHVAHLSIQSLTARCCIRSECG